MNIRTLAIAALFSAASVPALAGGFITNTNQSISFLRQPAQNAEISVNGAYYNPAGIGFLPDGWQLSIGVQNIHQTRQITSTFAPFALKQGNGGSQTNKYKGYTDVPVLPTFDVSYVNDKFFGSAHFGVIGGGGSAKFDDGLGSFESKIAMIPALVNSAAGSNLMGYDLDMHLDGKSFMIGGQLNVGYRVGEHLSLSAGARLLWVYNHYDAGLENIRLSVGGNLMDAAEAVSLIASSLGMTIPSSMAGSIGGMFSDRELDCTQRGLGIAPVLGVDFKTDRLNIAARYEFNTRVRLKNSTDANTTGMSQFDDGKSGMANDLGALLSLGARYEVLSGLRVYAGFNKYFDKQSNVYNSATGKNDKTDLIEKNPFEILAGVEYDINNRFTVSCGGQLTKFFWDDERSYISDMAFSISSFSPSIGFRYNMGENLSFDFAVFDTFYERTTKEMADYNNAGATIWSQLSPALSSLAPSIAASNPELAARLAGLSADSLKTPGTDKFYRTSLVIGFGINLKF